jgi:hypothetical protein
MFAMCKKEKSFRFNSFNIKRKKKFKSVVCFGFGFLHFFYFFDPLNNCLGAKLNKKDQTFVTSNYTGLESKKK